MLDVVLFNTHDMMLLITVYQCILFSVLVFFIRPKTKLSNILLVGFLLSTGAIPLDILISYGAGVKDWMLNNHPNWFYVFEFSYWVQGPFLLWYVRSVIYKNYSLTYWDGIYLLPFVMYFGHQLWSYHLLPSDVKMMIQQGSLSSSSGNSIYFITFAREVLRVFFGATCVYEIHKFRQQLKHRQGAEVQDFTWLNMLSYGFLGLWSWALLIASLILFSVKSGIPIDVSFLGLSANYITCLFIGVFIVFVSSRSTVFNNIERFATTPTQTPKNAIDLTQITALEELMLNDKPYLEHNLTLDALAEKLGVSPRSLSLMINRHYGYNFFEFVNHYRINEVKTMLLSPEHRNTTVLDIMYDCGFNSKATFNNFFKRVEGLTPREYKKRNIHVEANLPKAS